MSLVLLPTFLHFHAVELKQGIVLAVPFIFAGMATMRSGVLMFSCVHTMMNDVDAVGQSSQCVSHGFLVMYLYGNRDGGKLLFN